MSGLPSSFRGLENSFAQAVINLFVRFICCSSCTQNFSDALKMILKLLILSFFYQREWSKLPSFGKITIENKLKEVIRVTLSPAINWNYYEKRTNRTLSKNPETSVGGTYIT